MVIEGGIRDTQRIMQLDEFNGFVRGFDPTAIANVTLAEINGITRIGEATCLPGDVVLGTLTGVIFIPSHLAELVVTTSEGMNTPPRECARWTSRNLQVRTHAARFERFGKSTRRN